MPCDSNAPFDFTVISVIFTTDLHKCLMFHPAPYPEPTAYIHGVPMSIDISICVWS